MALSLLEQRLNELNDFYLKKSKHLRRMEIIQNRLRYLFLHIRNLKLDPKSIIDYEEDFNRKHLEVKAKEESSKFIIKDHYLHFNFKKNEDAVILEVYSYRHKKEAKFDVPITSIKTHPYCIVHPYLKYQEEMEKLKRMLKEIETEGEEKNILCSNTNPLFIQQKMKKITEYLLRLGTSSGDVLERYLMPPVKEIIQLKLDKNLQFFTDLSGLRFSLNIIHRRSWNDRRYQDLPPYDRLNHFLKELEQFFQQHYYKITDWKGEENPYGVIKYGEYYFHYELYSLFEEEKEN